MDAFIDVSPIAIPAPSASRAAGSLESLTSLQIGWGTKGFRADESGIWLGAVKWVDAPFRVDPSGNLVSSSGTFSQYLSKAGTSQSLTGDVQVGDANVKIDGANKRITINDGTNIRVVIGYVA